MIRMRKTPTDAFFHNLGSGDKLEPARAVGASCQGGSRRRELLGWVEIMGTYV